MLLPPSFCSRLLPSPGKAGQVVAERGGMFRFPTTVRQRPLGVAFASIPMRGVLTGDPVLRCRQQNLGGRMVAIRTWIGSWRRRAVPGAVALDRDGGHGHCGMRVSSADGAGGFPCLLRKGLKLARRAAGWGWWKQKDGRNLWVPAAAKGFAGAADPDRAVGSTVGRRIGITVPA